MRSRAVVMSVLACFLGTAAPARADEEVIPGHTVDRPVDGAVQGLALGATLGFSLIPMRSDPQLWATELLQVDRGVHDNFSRRAAHLSDALLVSSLAAPAIYLTGSTIDDADGDRLMIYGQSIAINAALAQGAKRLVQRPRPYNYSNDPAVRRYAQSEGDDAWMSFYSGHASLSFGAAVTGAYLLGASSDSKLARGMGWGLGLMAASATANLRVRAGKHFYSDVVIGAVIGVAVGYIVPALHADGRPYIPDGQELAAAGAGILGGLLISSLIPLEKKRTEGDEARPSAISRLNLSPVPMPNGIGLALGGAL
ncbi:MAG: phosphatase PAP2 family protein [Deltaproteobacteria bacterium]|nr:phosphatase PAP2 family protein [Deltaproteobacteria bacterium]